MDAQKNSISDIFTGARILDIPFFQRAYVWDKPQWERFLSDMVWISETNAPYFFGSIILKRQTTPDDIKTVVDGQQRLTTLSIFFKVLSLKMDNAKYLADMFRIRKNNELALRHNRIDIKSFNRIQDITKEINIGDEEAKDDKILGAYKYFLDEVNIEKIDMDRLLNNIMLVGINLYPEQNEDEQQIFDTINSLGVRLTTAELLKNYFFSRDNVKKYEETWQEIFEKDSEVTSYWDTEIQTGRTIRPFSDIFFSAFLQIKVFGGGYNVSNDDKKSFTRNEGLFNSYKSFIEKYGLDKNEMVEEIKEYAAIFKDNFSLDAYTTSELSGSYRMARMNALIFHLENTTLIPYVLFVLKNLKNQHEQDQIFDYLESYLMRRMICRSNNKSFSRFFGATLITNAVLTKEKLIETSGKGEDNAPDTTLVMPSDNEVANGVFNSVLINRQAAGVLYLLESRLRNGLYGSSLLPIVSYSLEHIMPKKWRNNWSSGSDEEAKMRDKKLLTIGNLTIITSALNSSIRDGNWETKRNGNPAKKYFGLKQYAAGLETFSTAHLELQNWNEETINDRTTFLLEKMLTIWPEK
ncbi:MAG: DUF262 domain-containing protein [Thermoguttaceae bacterium]